jgi:calcineurin-like phosphoesterase family protein
MANILLISDTHFGHANMLNFRDEGGGLVRAGFASVEEMDELMVQRWNSIVRPNDHVYHLGDVAMRREHLAVCKRLHGHKRLVLGNHDIFEARDYIDVGFKKLFGSRVLDGFLLTHIPIQPASMGRFTANIHGHIHERDCPPGAYVNVSVERIGYQPVPLEVIKKQAMDFAGLSQCHGNTAIHWKVITSILIPLKRISPWMRTPRSRWSC